MPDLYFNFHDINYLFRNIRNQLRFSCMGEKILKNLS